MIKIILAIIFASFVLYCLCLLEGCLPIVSPGQTQAGMIAAEPNTPQQILYKTVYKSDWIITGCTVGVGLCITAFLLGSKWALFCAVGCLATLALRLGTVRYAGWLAGASIVCAICLCVWVVLTRKKALTEIVKNIQDYKTQATGTIFKKSPVSLLREYLAKQSSTTQAIVKKIKENL